MKENQELSELEEIARVATFAALQDYEPVPEAWRASLTLGIFFENDFRIFELYVAGKRSQDAITISSARVNSETKAVDVVITNLARRV